MSMGETIFHDLFCAVPGVAVRCSGLTARYAPPAELILFITGFGPTGTARDALAEGMIRLAEENSTLAKGQPLVETGAGSFSAALALAGYRTGHPVTLCLPATMTDARQKQLTALGARLVLCNALEGQTGLWARAAALARTKSFYYTNWCANDLNPEYHRRVTAPALRQALDSKLDFLVAGAGSCGTLTGCGEYLKAWSGNIKVVAVEPAESQVLAGGAPGRHGLDGIGFGFVPENYNPYIVDKIQPVTTGDGKKFAGQALLCDGIPAAPSAGAVIGAGLELAMDPANAGKRVVAIVDHLSRY